MNRRHALGIGLSLLLVTAVSCATENNASAPKAIDGVLLRASDFPNLRLVAENPAADATGMAETLGGGESCACPTVFKDEVPVATTKLEGFGFKRGYAELWGGAGLHGAAFTAEFDTVEHATAAIGYMSTELFRECVNEPYCSTRVRVENPKIPGFVGLSLTPLRPPQEGRRSAIYKFLFRIESAVYGVMYGADAAYDPGSVSKAEALALAQRFYDRVKDRAITDVLRSAPASPLGAPHEPPPDKP